MPSILVDRMEMQFYISKYTFIFYYRWKSDGNQFLPQDFLNAILAKIKRITVKSVIFLPRSFLHLKLHNKFLAQGRAFTQIIKIAGFIKYIYAGLWWPSLKMRECSTAHDISHAHAAAHGFLICSEEKNQKISKCQQQLAGKLLILCYLFS